MEQNTSNLFELRVDPQAAAFLGQTARWAKFLAIVGFIMGALVIIMGIFAGTLMSTAFSDMGVGFGGGAGIGIIIVYILLGLFIFFPCLYLFRFAGQMQVALRNNDQATLTASFGNLKSYFKFVGIVMIIVLAFYALIIIFGILGATMASFS